MCLGPVCCLIMLELSRVKLEDNCCFVGCMALSLWLYLLMILNGLKPNTTPTPANVLIHVYIYRWRVYSVRCVYIVYIFNIVHCCQFSSILLWVVKPQQY